MIHLAQLTDQKGGDVSCYFDCLGEDPDSYCCQEEQA